MTNDKAKPEKHDYMKTYLFELRAGFIECSGSIRLSSIEEAVIYLTNGAPNVHIRVEQSHKLNDRTVVTSLTATNIIEGLHLILVEYSIGEAIESLTL